MAYVCAPINLIIGRSNYHANMKAVAAVVLESGMASGQLVKWSITVSRWVDPSEGRRGPTKSTCMWSKRRGGTWNVSSGALMCSCVLEAWQ